MHPLNLPTPHYRGIHSCFFLLTFHFCTWMPGLMQPDAFDTSSKGDILLLASCFQQSKQQIDLSINPINLAKLTTGPEHSVCVAVYLSVFWTSLSAFSSVASLGLTEAHSNPHHASLSEEETGGSMIRTERRGKQVLKISGDMFCVFSSAFKNKTFGWGRSNLVTL